MACHFPRTGYKARSVNPASGRRSVVFSPREGYGDLPVTVPCGQCLACRLTWAGDWAARCEKEAKLHEENCFITLTYGDEHLPIGGTTRSSLSKRDWQLFMKRLRKEYGDGIRFFATGEYGDQNQRAHYHALLFGHDFPDKQLWKSRGSTRLFLSASLDRLWGLGFTSVGAVTFQSAAYVARYVVKKLKAENAEYADRTPPFVLMSRRPGIGAGWYERFHGDVYPEGTIIVGEGKRRRAPRYFDEKFRKQDPEAYRLMRAARRRRALEHGEDSPRRLAQKNEVLIAQTNQLQRQL